MEKEIRDKYLEGMSIRKISNLYKISYSKIRALINDIVRKSSETYKMSYKNSPRKHTENTKSIMSLKRKKYLQDNPDKHPWRKISKFKSKPCENFKEVLNEMNISYISEFNSFDKNYSIDIAFPENKIAIEINGNQHYEKDGSLKKYYQIRHNYLKELGWTVYELHYLICFKKNTIVNIINNMGRENIFDFDYNQYLISSLNKTKKIKKCSCGKEISNSAIRCNGCNSLHNRRVIRPNINILLKDIQEIGYRGAGKKYGVSDNAIRKWVKFRLSS